MRTNQNLAHSSLAPTGRSRRYQIKASFYPPITAISAPRQSLLLIKIGKDGVEGHRFDVRIDFAPLLRPVGADGFRPTDKTAFERSGGWKSPSSGSFPVGRKERTCPLWKETIDAVRKYLETRSARLIDAVPLFVNVEGNRLSRFGLRYIIAHRVAEAAKISPTLLTRKITPHTIRRTTQCTCYSLTSISI